MTICPHWNPSQPFSSKVFLASGLGVRVEERVKEGGVCQGGWTGNPTIKSFFNKAHILLEKEMNSSQEG